MKRILTAVLGFGLVLTPVAAAAAADEVYTNWRDNVAAEGYDVVTFFSGKPQLGKAEYTTRYEGADWFFFNQANKDLFPDQSGAFCAAIWRLLRLGCRQR